MSAEVRRSSEPHTSRDCRIGSTKCLPSLGERFRLGQGFQWAFLAIGLAAARRSRTLVRFGTQDR